MAIDSAGNTSCCDRLGVWRFSAIDRSRFVFGRLFVAKRESKRISNGCSSAFDIHSVMFSDTANESANQAAFVLEQRDDRFVLGPASPDLPTTRDSTVAPR